MIPVATRFKLRQYLIHIIAPLSTGVLIYILGRSISSLRINYLLQWKAQPPLLPLPRWLIFNVPDGLWLYSLLMWMILIWQQEEQGYLWYTLLILMAFGSEILQKLAWISGTYDPFDLVAYLVAVVLCTINYYRFKTITK